MARTLAVAVLLAAPLAARPARAQVAPPDAPGSAPASESAPLTFTAVRPFSGPENTRIVFVPR